MGQNITFVDLTTSTERVSLGENVTFLVVCPTGSDVTYTLDFGDGTSFSAQEVDVITASPRTVVEVTSPGTAVFNHLVRILLCLVIVVSVNTFFFFRQYNAT